MTMGNISKCLENINYVYYMCGMFIETLYMNREFKKLIRIIIGTSIFNTTMEDEHVPEIERQVIVTKE